MSKKHFIAVAAAIKAVVAAAGQADQIVIYKMAGEMAAVFKGINPAFDKARFMAACGF